MLIRFSVPFSVEQYKALPAANKSGCDIFDGMTYQTCYIPDYPDDIRNKRARGSKVSGSYNKELLRHTIVANKDLLIRELTFTLAEYIHKHNSEYPNFFVIPYDASFVDTANNFVSSIDVAVIESIDPDDLDDEDIEDDTDGEVELDELDEFDEMGEEMGDSSSNPDSIPRVVWKIFDLPMDSKMVIDYIIELFTICEQLREIWVYVIGNGVVFRANKRGSTRWEGLYNIRMKIAVHIFHVEENSGDSLFSTYMKDLDFNLLYPWISGLL